MPKDLRSFMAELGSDLLTVEREVDPITEVAELSSKAPGPILFEKIKGYDSWRIVDNLVRTRKSQALAIGAAPGGVVRHLAQVLGAQGGECKRVSTGPVKERIFIGDKANLLDLPITKMSNIDAGRFIGSGMNITKDPETGNRNVACLRMQVKGPRRTGVMMVPRHTWQQFSKYEAIGKDMPMAVAIGHHPAWDIATNVTGPYEMDEYEVASRLLGEPAELVPAETIDLDVPAHAEIVIEGYVKAGVREEEGPFGEFTCFISGEGRNPVFEVTAITMRHDAIFRSIQATEFTEHQSLIGLPIEADIYRRVSTIHGASLDIHDVMVPIWGSAWLVVLRVTSHYEGEVKDALMSALSCNYLHPKIAVAVDEDVDIEDPADLWWAVSTRVNPAKDVFVTDGNRIHPMDVSCPQISPPGEKTWQRLGGKMGIGATKPSLFRQEERKRQTRCRPMGWGSVRLEDFIKGFGKP
jgi:2,5-furandicarboxylate decarboxylase 1